MKKKRILMIAFIAVLAVGLLACTTNNPPATSAAPSTATSAAPTTSGTGTASGQVLTLHIGMYADGADSYYQVLHDAMQACANDDPTCQWTIDYKVGQNTAAEQLQAVENFITAKYDAMVVIQNSVDTTSECIAKAKAAGIPYFGAVHSFGTAKNATDAAGSCGYDFVLEGKLAGDQAIKAGAKKVVMIEGQLGQGTAGAQTLGYLQAYEAAGKNLGGVTAEQLATQKNSAKQDGKQDITVVGWASGGWFADPAQKAMANFITSLGPNGFDSVYVQNNPMMEGVLQAMKDAGLDPAKYFLSSGNGREISWQWVKDGVIDADVNQTAALEGDVIYQQVKGYFLKQNYRKYVHPYMTEYDASNVNSVALIPFSDVTQYMEQRNAGKFVHDITDPKFTDMPNMGTTATGSPSGTAATGSPSAS